MLPFLCVPTSDGHLSQTGICPRVLPSVTAVMAVQLLLHVVEAMAVWMLSR
eukprot:COSAG01_NODE_1353_length_10613_cov_279.254708_4_plen_51_part_00